MSLDLVLKAYMSCAQVQYLIISKQPESRGLVVFIICNIQVICSCLKNGIFTPRLGFGFSFYHFTGVQGCLKRGQKYINITSGNISVMLQASEHFTSSVSNRPLSSYSERTVSKTRVLHFRHAGFCQEIDQEQSK